MSMTFYKHIALSVALALPIAASAQQLSLDSCRAMAISHNKSLRISELHAQAAHWQHQSAVSNYYPRLTAVGTYQHTTRSISLLSDESQQRLSNAGTNLVGGAQTRLQQFIQTPQAAAILQANPQLAAMLQDPASMATFSTMFDDMASTLDGVGQSIVDAFRTDTHNAAAAALMLTQPIYMGGKIRAYDKITRYAEQIAQQQHNMELQDLIVNVDEAYWRIVALQSKQQLAQSYYNTVSKLDSDVDKLVGQGMATKADGLSVKVKLNEAQVALIQVDNGLVLARMALAQLCGMPLDAQFELADQIDEAGLASASSPASASSLSSSSSDSSVTAASQAVETAMQMRPELQALDLATSVKQEQVNVARAEYLPNLALTAGYLVTNPSLYNGYREKFDGAFNIGFTLKVPIITWGDRIYKVRQAKAEMLIAETEAAQARERITLQVQQNQQKLQEASQRYRTALSSQQQANENLRMAQTGLREGVIPVSNVLEAQTAWLAAHATLVEADIDVRLAQLYLQRALGTVGAPS